MVAAGQQAESGRSCLEIVGLQSKKEQSTARSRSTHPRYRAGPVLLIDDMVDSKWTLTVAGYLLTTHGSGPVFPLALASTSHAE
jgi:phosphoribosylpyrophosphate synthetase